ncbi:MAG TPA: VPLPA-CTERM-specific exosortase XrtD [Dyella sp.]|uniref:VPLPA-CTERM-specific exosortase XrtD n=1 Tax=Dyella sp. TaxID=1869338 RepID=UPI002D7715F1|nr:VPLPA-CTERM-specific exosortase XrtD [Dyella sp.]HET6553594.1 VPLPA-CTERM-specific exosortase XrtD [Dyella sp.]
MADNSQEQVWRPALGLLLLWAVVLAVLPWPHLDGLNQMWRWWMDRPEYSFGILLPPLAAFLVWQQRDWLERQPFTGSWWGVAVTLLGAVTLILGRMASILTLVQYAFVISFCGVTIALVGRRIAARLMVPFLILLLMVPLPQFLYNNLSSSLQLLSSRIGVALIRACGVSVYLQGNVIDLGAYKLEVAEACSGLRYLFPLMTLGFIMAWFYKAAFWKRVLVLLSSIPLTIVMNSLRIAGIGVTVEHWGQAAAEGFLHDFEGWVMFMASAAVMLLEVVLLSKIGGDGRPWRSIFGVTFPAPTPRKLPRAAWKPTAPFMVAAGAVVAVTVATLALPQRAEAIPARRSFVEYPSRLEGWSGRRQALESVYLDALKLSDYLLADYSPPDGATPVSFYVAWYDSQRAGQSTHSPSSCLPGAGWRIDSMREEPLTGLKVGATPLVVNRALISYGDQRDLVYYWFQQRGRVLTNEYLVKWYLFWDALTRNRSDGALVRLIVPLTRSQDPASADRELQAFLKLATPDLNRYVPD